MAAAFDLILHKGVAGRVYNIGGTTEKSNIEVAQEIIKRMGLVLPRPKRGHRLGEGEGDGEGGGEGQQQEQQREEGEGEQIIEEAGSDDDAAAEQAQMERFMTFVDDRAFNDMRCVCVCVCFVVVFFQTTAIDQQ